jgi:hypothetical protein
MTGAPMAITNEIEVTPEMEEAGFRVLSASGIADDYLEADKLLVAEIYRAMHSLALASKRQAVCLVANKTKTEHKDC